MKKGKISSDDCSVEGVQLCMLNSQRLLEDSRKVSGPTKSALLELSLEECGKGIVMFYHALGNSIKVLPKEKKQEIESLRHKLFGNKPTSSKLENGMRRAIGEEYLERIFNNHEIKLDAIGTLLDGMKLFFSPFTSKDLRTILRNITQFAPALLKPIEENIGLADLSDTLAKIESDTTELDKAIEDIKKVLESFDDSTLKKLDEIKKTGFYVDFGAGALIYPKGLSDSENKKLEDLITNLLRILSVFLYLPQAFKETSSKMENSNGVKAGSDTSGRIGGQ